MRRLSRRSQLLVDGAGLLADATVLTLAMSVWMIAHIQFVLLLAALIGVRILYNLNPLLKVDGYYLLADAIRRPDLREAAMTALAARGARLVSSLRARRWPPQDLFRVDLTLAYALAAGVYSVVLVGAIALVFRAWILTRTADGEAVFWTTVILLAAAWFTRRGPRRRFVPRTTPPT